MKKLRELKARKAKYGFAYDYVGVQNFIELGRFMEHIEKEHSGKYSAEMVGMKLNDLRVYTDDDAVAHWIRMSYMDLASI